LYVLVRPSDLARGEEGQSEGLDTNKIDRFRDLRRDLIVARPSLPTGTKVCPLLKHSIHRRFLLTGTGAAHNTLYEVLCRFYIVRTGTQVPSNVPSPPRQDTVSKGCTIFRIGGERHEDSLIPEDQHPIIVDFSTRLDMLGHLIAIDIGLDQGLQTIRFGIIKELRCSPLFLYHWSRGRGENCSRTRMPWPLRCIERREAETVICRVDIR
jgi:hypothetical protein